MHRKKIIIMGILSGMLIACGIAFFTKKKLADKNTAIDEKKISSIPSQDKSNSPHNEQEIIQASNQPTKNESGTKLD